MVEPASALNMKLNQGRHGARGEAGVTLGSRTLCGLWQIAGWTGFEPAAAPVLNELGLTGLGDYRSFRQTDRITSWRIAPDRMLLEGCNNLSAHMSDDLVTLDLSHARAVITLEGRNARDLLAQLVAIEVSTTAFGEGRFLQTGIHHVGVLVSCTGPESFEILAPYTWAETIWEVFHDNALPHGLQIRSHQVQNLHVQEVR